MPVKTKDKRKQFKYQRVEYQGQSWNFDGKSSPDGNQLRVYRVHGDVSDRETVESAFMEFAIENGYTSLRIDGL